jgi:hypothetical protein
MSNTNFLGISKLIYQKIVFLIIKYKVEFYMVEKFEFIKWLDKSLPNSYSVLYPF